MLEGTVPGKLLVVVGISEDASAVCIVECENVRVGVCVVKD